MSTYLISFETTSPSLNVQKNIMTNAIKSFGIWAKPTSRVWLIKTFLPRNNVMSRLRNSAGPNDKILVMKVTNDWIARNLSNEVIRWMKSGL